MDVGDEIHVATVAAISATRAAARNELLAAKSDATVSAIAGFDCDFGFVDEHRYKTLRHKEGRLEFILWRPSLCLRLCLLLLDRLNGDESPRRAFILELHDAGNLCE